MKRLAGLETEYGCMAPESFGLPAVPTRVRDYIFKKKKLGLIDLHDRDYDEPAGNGGFLFHRGSHYSQNRFERVCSLGRVAFRRIGWQSPDQRIRALFVLL